MDLVVTYDVSTESAAGRRRLRKVAQACLNYGQRVQFSVFECRVTDSEWATFRDGLIRIVNAKEDSIRVYKLTGPREDSVWCLGIDRYRNFDGPLIV